METRTQCRTVREEQFVKQLDQFIQLLPNNSNRNVACSHLDLEVGSQSSAKSVDPTHPSTPRDTKPRKAFSSTSLTPRCQTQKPNKINAPKPSKLVKSLMFSTRFLPCWSVSPITSTFLMPLPANLLPHRMQTSIGKRYRYAYH